MNITMENAMSNTFANVCDEAVQVLADELETLFGMTECIVSLDMPSELADKRYVAIGGGCVDCHS